MVEFEEVNYFQQKDFDGNPKHLVKANAKIIEGNDLSKTYFDQIMKLKTTQKKIIKCLKIEYYIFANSFIKLYNGMNLNQPWERDILTESDNYFNSDSDSSNKIDIEELKKKLSATEFLKMCSFNLVSAFPNLFIAYKYLCTIPTT